MEKEEDMQTISSYGKGYWTMFLEKTGIRPRSHYLWNKHYSYFASYVLILICPFQDCTENYDSFYIKKCQPKGAAELPRSRCVSRALSPSVSCISCPHSCFPQEWIQNIRAKNAAPAWPLSGYPMDHIPGHARPHLLQHWHTQLHRAGCAELRQIGVLSIRAVWFWGRPELRMCKPVWSLKNETYDLQHGGVENFVYHPNWLKNYSYKL